MYCTGCGKEIPDDSRFCPVCGAPVDAGTGSAPERKEPGRQEIEGERITDSIYLCRDGQYRWVYEMPMLKNPTILFTVWKVLGIAFAAVFLLMQLFNLFEDNLDAEGLLSNLKMFGLLALAFLVISIIAYLIVAAVYGWKYVVLFEMNEKQIRHIQVSRQHSKAEILGWITVLAGLAGHSLTTTGIGLNAAARNSSTTEFEGVKSIRSIPRRHVIKLSQGLDRNQIYADGADYDFVLEYISSRCPSGCRKK